VTSSLGTLILAVVVVVSTTVALCLGHIDSQTFLGIIGAITGLGMGAGIHAAGVATTPSGSGAAQS
jgi:hypothetical protein